MRNAKLCASEKAIEATQLASIINSFAKSSSRFEAILERLTGVRSRLSGSRICESADGRPEPDSLVGELRAAIGRYNGLLDELNEEVGQLEEIA